MTRVPTARRSGPTVLHALLLAATLVAAPAWSRDRPQQRQLVLQLDLQRQGPVQAGAERGQQQLRQQWRLEASLESAGVLMINNPLDPDDARRAAERALAPQPPAARRAAGNGRPVTAAQGQALQADMQARVQAMQARCGADPACLARESAAISRGMQAALQAAGGSATPAVPDAEPEARFLHFAGAANCRLQATGRIDGTVRGSYNDVQGVVAYSETQKGEETLRDPVHCPGVMAVLDVKSGRVWVAFPTLPQQTRGATTREVQGRAPRVTQGAIGLRWWEGQEWLSQRLHNLTERGSDAFQHSAAGLKVELRAEWSFR
jgi:hypothetical protein